MKLNLVNKDSLLNLAVLQVKEDSSTHRIPSLKFRQKRLNSKPLTILISKRRRMATKRKKTAVHPTTSKPIVKKTYIFTWWTSNSIRVETQGQSTSILSTLSLGKLPTDFYTLKERNMFTCQPPTHLLKMKTNVRKGLCWICRYNTYQEMIP
jgi:hypothetical protein